jgi:hypothetical protein
VDENLTELVTHPGEHAVAYGVAHKTGPSRPES